MFSRLLPKTSQLRLLYNLSSKFSLYHHSPHHSKFNFLVLRSFSSNNSDNNNNKNNRWQFSQESDEKFDSFFKQDFEKHDSSFSEDSTNEFSGVADSPPAELDSWTKEEDSPGDRDIFEAVAEESSEAKHDSGIDFSWQTPEMWNLDERKEEKDEIFNIVEDSVSKESETLEKEQKEREMLEKEEKELIAILKGPNRAFGDLIAASGITDAMLDSLISLKDFEGIEGLPPLSEIEELRYEKNTKKSTRADIERQKQEEVAKARVRQVDDKGRAYGTGRRKCSVARVWVEPGSGKFIVNDKEFDVYFPMLDQRAALLRPFAETKTLGLWDVNCTVKGGGVSGQVGAIQLGISRALQSWEPDLRPPLRDAGFLTRDSRVVERKKPGKAKARKSFQWVKR